MFGHFYTKTSCRNGLQAAGKQQPLGLTEKPNSLLYGRSRWETHPNNKSRIQPLSVFQLQRLFFYHAAGSRALCVPFHFVDIGAHGKACDSIVFKDTSFRKLLEKD
jgi:hypothetical protein